MGITDYAQDALGDVVFVQLPEVGAIFEADHSLSEVESTKSVSDVYAPVRGTVVEVNADLVDVPGRLNDDPYGAGWICVMEPDDPAVLRRPARRRRLPGPDHRVGRLRGARRPRSTGRRPVIDRDRPGH